MPTPATADDDEDEHMVVRLMVMSERVEEHTRKLAEELGAAVIVA